jgi:pimeloyl-ACP methyl ester carboxylesterase
LCKPSQRLGERHLEQRESNACRQLAVIVTCRARIPGERTSTPSGLPLRSRARHQHLQIKDPIILVGHDIGLMIAYAYAQSYRNDTSHLVIVDAPLPGTDVFDRLRSNPRPWHFAFHNAIDVAEMLVAGRERQYLQTFFNVRNFDPSAIDLETYVSAYSAPGAMRAGFELYRAFE